MSKWWQKRVKGNKEKQLKWNLNKILKIKIDLWKWYEKNKLTMRSEVAEWMCASIYTKLIASVFWHDHWSLISHQWSQKLKLKSEEIRSDDERNLLNVIRMSSLSIDDHIRWWMWKVLRLNSMSMKRMHNLQITQGQRGTKICDASLWSNNYQWKRWKECQARNKNKLKSQLSTNQQVIKVKVECKIKLERIRKKRAPIWSTSQRVDTSKWRERRTIFRLARADRCAHDISEGKKRAQATRVEVAKDRRTDLRVIKTLLTSTVRLTGRLWPREHEKKSTDST